MKAEAMHSVAKINIMLQVLRMNQTNFKNGITLCIVIAVVNTILFPILKSG